jgi:hypothetical protein
VTEEFFSNEYAAKNILHVILREISTNQAAIAHQETSIIE